MAHALAAALGVVPDELFIEPPANVLVRLRLFAGITQQDAAALLDLPASLLSQFEHPDAAVPTELTAALAAALATEVPEPVPPPD